ncbi:MAG TPA: hypothetical protein VM284_01755 [Candidatus Limnocylindria bacterium]|nr:hypothetical protein [Candidatus Limnocylindria bacterium]
MEDLKGRVADLTPDQSYVELCRLVTLLSRNGQDGHQFVIPFDDVEGPVLPFRTYEFEEGVFITDAMPGYTDLIGKQIYAINDHPIGEVLQAIEPLVPRDGPQTVPGFRTIFFLRMEVLRGLGLADETAVKLDVHGTGDTVETVSVTPAEWPQWRAFAGDFGIALPTRAETLYLTRPGPVVWSTTIDDGRAFYVRYEAIRSPGPAAITAIQNGAAAAGVEKVILDIRQNGGGDNGTFATLYSALTDPAVDLPGRLYVLIDRITFSAAGNLATKFDVNTNAMFAGEPSGGGVNFWDDVTWVDMPNWPLPSMVGVSTRYWEFGPPDDPRLTIEPDIAVPVTASDYFADRDPVLEAVLAH